MRKLFLVLTVLTVIQVCGFGHAHSEVTSFFTDSLVYDFGPVALDSVCSHIFTIKNITDEDICIRRVVSNCDCVEASVSSEKILAGESVELEVMLTADKTGDVTKIIYVHLSDKNNPVLMFRVFAQVGV